MEELNKEETKETQVVAVREDSKEITAKVVETNKEVVTSNEDTGTASQAETKSKKPKKKKKTKLEKWFARMRRWHSGFIRIFFPYKRVGHTEYFNDRNYIIVGNHKSVLDVIPAAISMQQPVHFMAKKELWDKKLGKWFTTKCECIPVNRDGGDVRAMMLAMKYLKNGETVCIFPEGTRNKTEDIFLPFKSGAAALSIKTKTPILPIIQVRKIKAFKKSYYYYGEPLEFSEYYDKKVNDADIKACDEKLRQVLLDMYIELDEKLKKKKK